MQVSDLPDDMQVLLTDIVEGELGTEALGMLRKHRFRARRVPLSWFPHARLDTRERGSRYAGAMIGQHLPPIVVCGRKWVDGRHRVWALRRSGCTRVDCIDIAEIGCSYPFPHLGKLPRLMPCVRERRPRAKMAIHGRDPAFCGTHPLVAHLPPSCSALAPEDLCLIDAFTECGATVAPMPATRKQPKGFFVQTGQLSVEIWVYAWTLTHGGGAARPRDEYRVQLTGVAPPLDMNPRGPTLLVGYEPNLECFAGFDLRKHQRFSVNSPSIQININALHDALRDGFSFVTKGNDEIAIGFRPDHILAYGLNAELLHSQGADARVVGLLTRAAALAAIGDEELRAVSKERRKLVATVARLSRDSDFRRKVIVAYDRRCAVTGIQLRLVDAAHILPVGAAGSSDEVNNGLCLSPTYHRAYDRGLIYLDASLVMRLNARDQRELLAMQLAAGIGEFRSCLDRPIRLPPDRRQWPDTGLIEKANAFRGISA